MSEDDCLFCKMADGDADFVPVYEADRIVAIMDIYPINPGHLLVFPRPHESDFHHLEESLYSELMQVSKELAGVLDYIYEPKKVGLLIAGFDISHVHVHLVPMYNFHDITSKKIIEGQRGNPSDLELEDRAREIRDVVDEDST